jgi:hypothetical protein
MSAAARALLRGAVDTHIHSSPDLVPRKLDDFELARQARDLGMHAIVLKNHFFSTVLRAQLVSQQVPGIHVVASIVLNQPMGGMNPWAVEAAARGGARIVWMPTAHAENQVTHEAHGSSRHPAAMELEGRETAVRIFGEDGRPSADADAVMEIIRDRDLVLASGHLTPDETEILISRAQEIGVRRIVVTHPELPVIRMPIDMQKRLASRGVMFERTYNVVSPYQAISMADLAAAIREVGLSSTICATDYGQPPNPVPAEGLEAYIDGLLANGFSEAEIRTVSSENARRLLDI